MKYNFLTSNQRKLSWTSTSSALRSLSRQEVTWAQSLETANSSTREVSVLSWNILSQHLFDSTPQWYQYVSKDAPLSWPDRLPRIIDEILYWKADIVCLQEVELTAFHDLESALQKKGYRGVMQSEKKRTGDYAYGVATFFKNEKFRITRTIHRSRTMLSLLEDRRNLKIIAIINCHLEGSPEKSDTRVKQLYNIFHESTKFTHHDVIVCGDFNCILNESACSTYLQKGSCEEDEDIYEWGRLVNAQVSSIPSHTYNFKSAYPIEILNERPLDYVTFVSSPHRFVSGLDQIWYHVLNGSVSVKAIKHPFLSAEQRKNILESGLPSIYHPSDHLPIGCIFEWRYNANPKNLRLKPSTDRLVDDMSETELRRAALKLLDSFSFDSEEQKADFLYITSGIEGDGYNSDDGTIPNNLHIHRLRDQRARKKKLFSQLPNEKVHQLEEILKLLKRANSIKKHKE